MFEYHGWATLSLSPGEEDENDLARFAERLRARIAEFGDGSGVCDVRVVNASWHVWLAGNPNHRHPQVLRLFPYIARHAPGSYGLLYVWDDEDAVHENAFRVFRLARGRVDEVADPHLSPCEPTIVDPW
jgi:hypothetical protein